MKKISADACKTVLNKHVQFENRGKLSVLVCAPPKISTAIIVALDGGSDFPLYRLQQFDAASRLYPSDLISDNMLVQFFQAAQLRPQVDADSGPPWILVLPASKPSGLPQSVLKSFSSQAGVLPQLPQTVSYCTFSYCVPTRNSAR
jgi:hypothetical protein